MSSPHPVLCAIRYRLPAGLALCACLALLGPARADGASNLRGALEDLIASGRRDSARVLVVASRVRTELVVESLLVAHELKRPPALAQAIADLYAEAFADSLCLRWLRSHRSLSDTAREEAARGWRAYRAAEGAYDRSRFAAAESSLVAAVARARAAGDRHLEQVAHTLHGSCRWMAGDFEDARARYRRALALAEADGHETQRVRLLRNIAATYNFQNRGDEAIDVLKEVVAAAEAIGDWTVRAQALNDIGIHDLRRGDLDAARTRFAAALDLARAHGLRRLEGNVQLNLGLLQERSGDPVAALHHFEAALAIARELDNRRGEVGALLNAASVLAELEQYAPRLSLLRQALETATAIGAQDAAAQIRNEIGETCMRLGRPRDAAFHHREALDVFRHLGIVRSQCVALHNLGVLEVELGRPAEALALFREAAALMAVTHDPAGRAGALVDVALAHLRLGEGEAAVSELRIAASIADTLDNPVLCNTVEHALGRALLACDERDRAAACFDRILQRCRRLPPALYNWQAALGRALVAVRNGRLARADSYLVRAIDHVETVRGSMAGESFRLGYMEDKRELYVRRVAGLVMRAADAPDPEPLLATALRVAEQARGRMLLDLLGSPAGDVDSTSERRYLTQLARLNRAQSDLARAAAAEAWDARRVDSLSAHLEAVRRDFLTSRDMLAASGRTHGGRSVRHAPLDAGAIRARVLAPDQLLIEYVVDREATYLLRLDHETLRAAILPVGADSLAARIARLREAMQSGSAGTGEDESGPRELYNLLLRPALGDSATVERLLIVPDGPLFYLPFAALHDGGRAVGERYGLCCPPSASAIDPALTEAPAIDPALTEAGAIDPSLADGGARGAIRMLAVGNPASYRSQALAEDAGRTAEDAVRAAEDALRAAEDVMRAPRDWSFGELPYAAEEARRVAGHFSSAQVLLGPQATEEAIKAHAPRASHLHFATHGLLDEVEPLMSALVLAQDEDPAEDGLLQVHEILDMDLHAELVVLSACNTARGRLTGGEGLLGLSHAFLCAGARTLLISLWEIPDRSTADLMDRFYTHLAGGRPADLALRDARRDMRALGAPPRSWAAFLVSGRVATAAGTAPAGARGRALTIGVLSGVALLGAAAAALVLRGRRRRTAARGQARS